MTIDINTWQQQLVQSLKQYTKPAQRMSWQACDDLTPEQCLASRLGGPIYWPVDQPYPQHDGQPLIFLAQLNFAQLPEIQGYPKEGLVQFLIAATDVYGCEFGSTASTQHENSPWRVVYWPNPVYAPECMRPAIGVDEYVPHQPSLCFLMTFSEEIQTPSIMDVHFTQATGFPRYPLPMPDGADETTIYDDLYAQAPMQSQVGGYAGFTQDDPRPDDTALMLLLQLDSCDDVQMMWGDSGIAQFFIDPKRLAQADFSQILYNWDCC